MRQEASRPSRIAKLIMPRGSAQVGFENTKSLHSWLDFGARRRRDGPAQTHFEQIAALMNCFPEFIDLARFKPYGFIANTCRLGNTTTQRQSRNGLKERIIRLHKRPAARNGVRSEGLCKRLLKLSSRNTHLYVLHRTVRTVRLGLRLCFRARSSHAYPQ
jgi:hypothetical protein